jgi:uncharacterized protein YeeX (DUF496 family)
MQFKDFRALENLLKAYKELKEENKELKENCKKCVVRDRLHEYVENTIPKSKVKEEIEEIDIDSIEEFELAGCNVKFNDTFISTESLINDMVLNKINELTKAIKQINNKLKEPNCKVGGTE